MDANKRSEDEILVWDEQMDLKKTDRKLIKTRPIKQMFRYQNIMKNENPGPRLNIKTVSSTYGDFHVKDKTADRTSYL